MKERLQKLISAAGIASRRQAEEYIKAGRVTVNGVPAQLGESADPKTDLICLDGNAVMQTGKTSCIMLHKPRGYVTTMHDEKGRPTVAELVSGFPRRVYPIGRLDMDSDGLLLLTNDGALAHALMHPKHEIRKTYRTQVKGDLAAALPLLRDPMVIDGYTVCADRVEIKGDGLAEITIHEGRNRQIRKMCAAAGLRVVRLTRIAEGPLRLGDLAPGDWRELSENELSALRNSINAPKNEENSGISQPES